MPVWTRVTRDPLEPSDLLARVGGPGDGAVLLFLGTVRNNAEGGAVTGITYEAYEAMADTVLREIATEAAEAIGSDGIAVAHRVGELEIGEVSVAIAVSSPHRAPAFEGCRGIIEAIKERLPVWKREHYADGREAWVEGVDPRGPGVGALGAEETGS